MRQTIVFLLAGGEGTRLYPLTRGRAKPAVPFGGLWRLVDFTLSNCLHSGFSRVCILTQYHSGSLTRHISRTWRPLGSAFGESIDFLPPRRKDTYDVYRGTADAVYRNVDTILREGARDVIIVCGDHVYAMDYRPLLTFHRECDADLTIATSSVPQSEAYRFGILRGRDDGRVISFIEKPKDLSGLVAGEEGTVKASMGVYIFKTRLLVRKVQEGPDLDRKLDFGGDVIPGMIDHERVFLYPFETDARGHAPYWRDVGTLDSYFQANMDLLGPSPEFDVRSRTWPIMHAPDWTGASLFTRNGARNSIIASGCRIDGEVSDSVISSDVTVETGACVSRAILLPGVHVEAGASIHDAILDKNVRILRGAIIGDGSGRDLCSHGGKVVYSPGRIAIVAEGEVVGGEGIERTGSRVHRDEIFLDREVGGGVPIRTDEQPCGVGLQSGGKRRSRGKGRLANSLPVPRNSQSSVTAHAL